MISMTVSSTAVCSGCEDSPPIAHALQRFNIHRSRAWKRRPSPCPALHWGPRPTGNARAFSLTWPWSSSFLSVSQDEGLSSRFEPCSDRGLSLEKRSHGRGGVSGTLRSSRGGGARASQPVFLAAPGFPACGGPWCSLQKSVAVSGNSEGSPIQLCQAMVPTYALMPIHQPNDTLESVSAIKKGGGGWKTPHVRP